MIRFRWFVPAFLLGAILLPAQSADYILGTDDRIFVGVLDFDEIKADKAIRVDSAGDIQLPAIGSVHVAGLTVAQTKALLEMRFKRILRVPDVTVTVSEFRNRPVSVVGAVKLPGVQQIHGKISLSEAISLAGGLDVLAGNNLKVTRAKAAGPLPLPGAKFDPSGEYQVAEVSLQDLFNGAIPASNIQLLPEDVVSVPKADPVYVIGAVKKAGGFVLNDRKVVTVLEALSLAEGLGPYSAAQRARILRRREGVVDREEIIINLRKMLAGQMPDQPLLPNDILYVPSSGLKEATLRGVEAAIVTASGITIFRVGQQSGVGAVTTAK
jgi:polysaccharide export outer membrane protein